jgi:hypothetical protein
MAVERKIIPPGELVVTGSHRTRRCYSAITFIKKTTRGRNFDIELGDISIVVACIHTHKDRYDGHFRYLVSCNGSFCWDTLKLTPLKP